MQARLLCDRIIVPTLYEIGMYSESAVRLLLGTGAQESSLGIIRQIGFSLNSDKGAFGPYGQELESYNSLFADYLDYYPAKKSKILAFRDKRISVKMDLMGNPFFATAIARAFYSWQTEPLPDKEDIRGMACYWDKYYNRNPEKGTPGEFIENYNLYVSGFNDA